MMLPKKYHHLGSINEEVAFNHEECGDTRQRLFVKRTAKGYAHHCHNCAPMMSGFTRCSDLLTASELTKALEPKESISQAERQLTLPYDYTTILSPRVSLWLQKWITPEEIKQYRIGYSPRMERIIFPVFDAEGQPIYWQARSISGEKPKYINRSIPGRGIFFTAGDIYAPKICIVEAILSAIAVGRSTHAIALMGSYIPREIHPILKLYGEEIYVWLDPDKQRETIKSIRGLAAHTNKKVIPILTDKKPKDYTPHQIQSILISNKGTQIP